MDFLGKIVQKLENANTSGDRDLVKSASDTATDLIKELSGKSQASGSKVVDNVIVFSNAAGGAGATTITHNVAYQASKKGLKVVVVDLDITRPLQHIYLGVKSELEKNDMVSYLLGKSNLADSIDTTNAINLLYANNRTLNDEVNCNDKIAIENFVVMINKLRQYYDLVLVDCPMRVDSMLANTMLYICDTMYIVWDEGIASSVNTEKLRRNMAISGIDSFIKMKIILNKRTSIRFNSYPLKKLNLELIEILPFDADIIDNSNKGQIFCEKYSSASKNAIIFAEKIQDLTDKILQEGGYIE